MSKLKSAAFLLLNMSTSMAVGLAVYSSSVHGHEEYEVSPPAVMELRLEEEAETNSQIDMPVEWIDTDFAEELATDGEDDGEDDGYEF